MDGWTDGLMDHEWMGNGISQGNSASQAGENCNLETNQVLTRRNQSHLPRAHLFVCMDTVYSVYV